ncbi:acetyl-CoA carboxylase biotin carboxylase subunit [Ramlibacter albus]|uniref:Acetyl-CoA carboxylase biotin carboxylase subunit n=1 Tax=Ramlibacter albus TaxID=2079448 RepID=A0A923M597_9BURK|nr:acetyl-CoA carboxylase biotin carboxylase subunit [Ramlibacter albus]MBC5762827.1 acetyl-CoA carboxylase biotin carboxylase subunit [Ramlibacter albus]
MPTPFHKILIANRGEIACRVIRTARAQGYLTVAVYSEADAGALHVRQADEALCIGPAPARESYLNMDAVLGAAGASGADAIHPGYGFLSENAAFARAVQAAGLVFIGPDPHSIERMGNKAAAKRMMIQAGVPCVPGYHGADQSDTALLAQAREIGAPIMVKAAAGGGGRGMRIVHELSEMADALSRARSEAANAFGSDELILERAVIEPRHVEVQVFGDRLGNIIHLGERDCSIQRRHQKVFEESPSPAVDAALRARMGAAAVAAAKTVDYVGAGTVEFLLDSDGRFYFLEMNTRLQVEHPVTECVTGLDLVAWQLAVARGEPLPLRQEEVRLEGHAIEVRLYAEDPANDFLPQSGGVALWEPPSGEGVRVDHGLAQGQAISPFYDPMIAKIIARGGTRDEARRRLVGALRDTRVLGLPTNLGFLADAARHPEFASGHATTAFIGRHFGPGQLRKAKEDSRILAIAAALWFDASAYRGPQFGFRSNGAARWPLTLGGDEGRASVHLTVREAGRFKVECPGGVEHEIVLEAPEAQGRRVSVDGVHSRITATFAEGLLHVAWNGRSCSFEDLTYAPPRRTEDCGDSSVSAPMNGRLLALYVATGDKVTKGQRVAVLEAMKMEHQLLARRDGTVERIGATVGEQVTSRAVIVKLAGEQAA